MNPEELRAFIDQRIEQQLDERFEAIESQIRNLADTLKTVQKDVAEHRATLVVLSGDLDKLFAAFSIALGASSSGMQVTMFFTFWGLNALRNGRSFANKSLSEKMIAAMLPSGPAEVPSSKMNMAGLGPKFFKHLMNKKKVSSLPEMIQMARELEIRMIACHTSMSVMGIKQDELLHGIEFGGVASYMEVASKSKVNLFI
jgi:peroxiredoxin family protein